MYEPVGHYAKWKKPDRERQIQHGITYMWNLKNKNKKQNKTKQQAYRYREQIGGCQRWEVGEREMGKNKQTSRQTNK